MAPIVAALFYFLPAQWLFLFLTLVALIAVYEIAAMIAASKKYLLVFLSLVALLPLYFQSFRLYLLWLLASPLIYLIVRLLQGGGYKEGINEEIIRGVLSILFGEIFVVLPIFSMYMLKELDNLFPFILLLAVWASDTCAYAAGRAFGKRPLAPQMSPKKTCEGLLGAVLGTMIVIFAAQRLLGFEPLKSLVVGAAMGLIGQAGDLLESVGKRVSHTKDSSSLIPGHGGILDRMDSFVFTAPFLYLCVIWKA